MLPGGKTVKFNPDALKPRGGMEGVLDIVNFLDKAAFVLFLSLIFSSFHFFNSAKAELSHLIWVYAFVVILFGLRLCITFLAGKQFMPAVSYDLMLLTYTAFISILLFTNTLSKDVSPSIWGGQSSRVFSGLSIIAVWFLYYLVVARTNNLEKLARQVGLLLSGPIFATIFVIMTGIVVHPGVVIALASIFPGLMLLSGNKSLVLRLLSIINLLLLLLFAVSLKSSDVNFVLLVAALVAIVFELITQARTFIPVFKNFFADSSRFIKGDMSVNSYLANNGRFIYRFVLKAVIIILSVNLYLQKYEPLQLLNQGMQSLVNGNTPGRLLLGNGLSSATGSYLTQFVHIHGVLALIALIIIVAVVIKDLFRNQNKSTLNQFIGLGILVNLVVFIFHQASEIQFIVFWILLAWAGSLKFIAAQKQKKQEQLKLWVIKNYGWFKFVQLAVVLVSIFTVIYFLNILTIINKYLT